MQDVWDVVDLLIEEVKHFNNEGKSFDVGRSINAQLPFFSCLNVLYDKSIQKDIERYMYCQQFGISPYPGNYGNQPYRWVHRSFLIKNAIAKKEKEVIDGSRKDNN